MPTCSDCGRDLCRRDFSQGQLRKDPTQRRCKQCIGSTRGSVEATRASDYYNSDAEDRPKLRFGVGDRVECNHNCGLWFHGTVIKLWYLNDDAEDDEAATEEEEEVVVVEEEEPPPSCFSLARLIASLISSCVKPLFFSLLSTKNALYA